ncbi:MAG: methionine synthase [Candidatus Dormibacteraeota bacterium]|uniref:Methionine synthase n=1 Tax=Candidatus Amunia macphersoniae TaxID=3127014 RepID=A0A934KEL7_9BACT|nr:methionine synthase [Candidatus Dormibacteraeota bacterium]
MPRQSFLDALSKRVLVYDGAMGTGLQALEPTAADFGGPALEGWMDGLVLHAPHLVERVHRSFLEVGCDVLETATFQATRVRLVEWGQAEVTLELNRSAAALARRLADEYSTPQQPRFVAGSIGPSGFLPSSSDPSLSRITFGELVETFTEQAQGLVEGGSDLLIIETAQDILEVRAAIFGCRQAFSRTGVVLPLHASVSLLDTSGTMLLGTDPGAVVAILDSLGVDVIGLNCSTGPELMRDGIRLIVERSSVPVACIPNAGIPSNVGGRAHFPLGAVEMAAQLEDFVRRLGVAAVGGCCGSTAEHIAELVARVRSLPAPQRAGDGVPRLASAMSAVDLHQQPAPLLIGERVNAQGSRAVKRLLLEEDYEGMVAIGRGQAEGGAHALDVCVAVTERSDEAEQMRAVVRGLEMSVDAPLIFDSTDAAVIRTALESYPGRAVVNSVNLENGRTRCETVLPLVRDHGAAVVALTIDEQGMANTADRKLAVATRIRDIACDEFRLQPHQILFDALTFTLATGEAEYIDSAHQTIEGIRRIKQTLGGVLTVLGVSNVSFGLSAVSRPVLNSVFLYHCVQAGLDAAIVNPAHITPYAEIGAAERELAEDLIFNRRGDALARYIGHFDGAETVATDSTVDPFAGMPPAERIHAQILQRRRDGIEEQIDLAVGERAPVAVLNEVLLPAMKEVGDRFGAGELILPFVLQSAEVMKRAVSQLEKYLDRVEGTSKGTIVLATVYGDVHDIGKNLVNTILSNNGYTVHDLGKQVPLTTIIDRAVEVGADIIGLSALLVSTSKQMPLCLHELSARGLAFPVIIGGAAINRGFGRRILTLDDGNTYDAGVFYCKDAFEGLDTVEQLRDEPRRVALLGRMHDEAVHQAERDSEREARRHAAATANAIGVPLNARSDTATDIAIPAPPFWGAHLLDDISIDEVTPCIDRNSLFKMSWQFKGVHDPQRWAELLEQELEPRLARSIDEARHGGWLRLQAVYGYWPALADGDSVVIYDPKRHDVELARFTFPRQRAQNRLCLADYVRPLSEARDGERDVVALQLVTTGPGASELSAQLQRDGEYDDMLRVHGFATQMAEATAEWLHLRIRGELGLDHDRGRRYSWGYPSCPDLADHQTFFSLVPADLIGVELTEGFQLVPEQSTAAIVLHHPQARYFAVYGGGEVDGPGAPEAEPRIAVGAHSR